MARGGETAKSGETARGGGAGGRSGPRPGGGGRSAQERARQQLEEQRRQRLRRQQLVVAGTAVGLVALVVLVMVLVKVTSNDSGGSKAKPDAQSVASTVAAVTGVPAALLDQVGKGRISGPPKAIKGLPEVAVDGKPLVLYVGAEFCPYCAAQRWGLVVALARFGTFANLDVSRSASDDVFPDTPTLTFHGSTYTSQYLTFQGLETRTNERSGGDYAPLDQLSQQQDQLFRTVNRSPYVEEDAAGTIPFLDFGNRYLFSGSTFSPQLLKDMSAAEVAAQLSKPDSDVARAVLGSANAFTATLCKLTNNQPGDVCATSAAKAYAGNL